MRKNFQAALQKAVKGKEKMSRGELVTLLQAKDGGEKEALLQTADDVRKRHVGDEVHFRGLIEFSNYCAKNCCYCGLRRDNKHLCRYRMEPEELLNACRRAITGGFKTLVLQSGEDPEYPLSALCRIINTLKQESDVAITLSLGEKDSVAFRSLRNAGADRYLLKHETSDSKLFDRLRPGTNFQKRVNCLIELKRIGFQVGSGNMVGLPGQDTDTLAKDLALMRNLRVEMAGIGPFIPSLHTPLAGFPPGTLELSLRVIAATRLVLPRAHVPATTALATLHPSGRELALRCGANVIMPNVTPDKYRPHYQIYPGKVYQEADTLRSLVLSLGRKISRTKGDAPLQGNYPEGKEDLYV